MKPVLFAALLLSASLSAAEVYKCKDSAGKTLYQDTPCQNGQQKVLKDLPSNSIKGPAVASKVASPDNPQSNTQAAPQTQTSATPSSSTGTANCSDDRYRNSDACRSPDLLRNKELLPDRPIEKPIAPVKPQPLPARQNIPR